MDQYTLPEDHPDYDPGLESVTNDVAYAHSKVDELDAAITWCDAIAKEVESRTPDIQQARQREADLALIATVATVEQIEKIRAALGENDVPVDVNTRTERRLSRDAVNALYPLREEAKALLAKYQAVYDAYVASKAARINSGATTADVVANAPFISHN